MTETKLEDGFLSIENSPTAKINKNYIITTDKNRTMILAKKDTTSDSQKWTREPETGRARISC